MESPETWDLLTASLAISNLKELSSTWAFLVVQGLVRDAPGDRDAFRRFAQYEVSNEITGPSTAARVALSLRSAGIALPVGHTSDPRARMAAERLASIERWTGRDAAKRYLEQMVSIEPQSMNKTSKHNSLDQRSPSGNAPKSWWKFW
jgi:hypothetical protein